MSKSSIARKFKASVVVVQSGTSSGTGFVVGKSGYLLTCAHCVPDADDIQVALVQNSGKSKTYKADLGVVDDEKDIALLKIDSKLTFSPVRLGVGHPVEMGMAVSVIGNPGVGDVVLDYTMTEGIVSNTRRSIGGMEHIQTSAAINAGNSGGPMFDEHGNVCGVVVLKADIEEASFAIPAGELADFLMSHLAYGKSGNAIQRSWFNANGAGPVVATFLDYKDGEVRFRRTTDGLEFKVRIATLSEPDRAFLKLFAKHKKAARSR